MNHSKPVTMKAVRCHRFASIEEQPSSQKQKNKRPSFRPRKQPLPLRHCLSLDEVQYPTLPKKAKGTWVVIKTEYAGIQYPDALQARGLYQIRPRLPYIPGMDVVGTVLKLMNTSDKSSSSATHCSIATANLRPGDRVMATLVDFSGTGGLSEVVLSSLKYVYKLPIPPPTSSFDRLRYGAIFANIGRNYFAAYHSLVEVGHIDPSPANNNNNNSNASKIILVDGASGGVGMATIELAKAMGCIVVAGVGSLTKSAGPKSVGADAVFCYGRTKAQRKAFRRQVTTFCRERQAVGVDLVVDVVMGDLFQDALVGCLKPLGTIALVGFAAGQKNIKPGILLIKQARVAGSIWTNIAMEASESNPNNKYSSMVHNILGYLSSGRISGRVDKIVPVSRFIEAFEIFEENKGRGNTVVSFVLDDEQHTNLSRL